MTVRLARIVTVLEILHAASSAAEDNQDEMAEIASIKLNACGMSMDSLICFKCIEAKEITQFQHNYLSYFGKNTSVVADRPLPRQKTLAQLEKLVIAAVSC